MNSIEKLFGIQLNKKDVIDKDQIDLSKVVSWLIKDYFAIYYIDLETNNYVEFSPTDNFKELAVVESGEDFFKDAAESIKLVAYPDDLNKILALYDKNNIINSLHEGWALTSTYRLLRNNKVFHVGATFDYVDKDDKNHIFISIRNRDNEFKWLRDYEFREKQTVTYSSIASSLARDYFVIYYINVDDNTYIEYSSSQVYKSADMKKDDDFFAFMQKVVKELVHPHDRDRANKALSREEIINALQKSKSYIVNLRVVYKGVELYLRLKALKMDDNDKYIILAASDVTEQVRMEKEYDKAMQLARRDALTGVKSKYAFDIDQEKIKESINSDEDFNFALAVCDVNNLKAINDNYGHQEGDKYLCDACSIICNVFKHSPVYRIGGDEFAVVLVGNDYLHRDELLKQINEIALGNISTRRAVVACGICDYEKGRKFDEVFEEADAKMYRIKNYLKDKDLK